MHMFVYVFFVLSLFDFPREEYALCVYVCVCVVCSFSFWPPRADGVRRVGFAAHAHTHTYTRTHSLTQVLILSPRTGTRYSGGHIPQTGGEIDERRILQRDVRTALLADVPHYAHAAGAVGAVAGPLPPLRPAVQGASIVYSTEHGA
jgi:hypothetical protein